MTTFEFDPTHCAEIREKAARLAPMLDALRDHLESLLPEILAVRDADRALEARWTVFLDQAVPGHGDNGADHLADAGSGLVDRLTDYGRLTVPMDNIRLLLEAVYRDEDADTLLSGIVPAEG